MITLLLGENSFEIQRELERIAAGFGGAVERIDGSELELKQLPDLLMGMSLFAERRLVIVKNLSENKAVWTDFGDWLGRVSDDIHLVLVEPKPDKRMRTYKELHGAAEVKEYKSWGERDTHLAEQWAMEEARRLGMKLDATLARELVRRTGVDQWAVFHALEKLVVLDTVTKETIEDVVELTPAENVFQLFETALKGNREKTHEMIRILELSEDPFKVFGLLSSQAFQLTALAVADKPAAEVAKDIGAHPFVLSKLAAPARALGRNGAGRLIAIFQDADMTLKTSAGKPWLLIEQALIKVTMLIK